MLGAILGLWDTGLDTNRIAKVLNERECEIERLLHIALEQRRRDADDRAGSP